MKQINPPLCYLTLTLLLVNMNTGCCKFVLTKVWSDRSLTTWHSLLLELCSLPLANEVWGKVIFFTCLSVCSWGSTWTGTPLVGTPPWQVQPPWQVDPPAGTPPWSSACWEIRSTSGRYASYWNAFLFIVISHC